MISDDFATVRKATQYMRLGAALDRIEEALDLSERENANLGQECETLTVLLDEADKACDANGNLYVSTLDRAKEAEAERDRLREALDSILRHVEPDGGPRYGPMTNSGWLEYMKPIFKVARAALSGKEPE